MFLKNDFNSNKLMPKRTRITKNKDESIIEKTGPKRKLRLWDDSVVIDESNMDDEFIIGGTGGSGGMESIEELKSFEDLTYLRTLSPRKRRQLEEEEMRLNKLMSQDVPLKYRILELEAPDSIKTSGLTLIKRYQDDPENNSTCLTAAEKICELPWNQYHSIDIKDHQKAKYLENSYTIMNQVIYGQDTAKLEIVEYLASYISNNTNTRVLGLHGPPGIGKTSLIKNALSQAMGNRPVFYVSLGGANDAAFLNGSRPVWKGSQQGQLVNALIQSKCMNPIIYFDELDKVSETEKGEDIFKFLVHLTDPEQNSYIYDNFLNIGIDMSNVLFVFSYNYRDRITSPPLLERIKEINLEGFDNSDKVIIAGDYVIPKVCREFGLKHHEIAVFSKEVIEYINSKADWAEGVRPLLKVYQSLISKILTNVIINSNGSSKRSNLLKSKYTLTKIKLPLKLTTEIVDQLLS